MPPTFILVSGGRYAGKDTVAAEIAGRTGWTHTSFAYAVKAECAVLYALSFDRLLTDTPYKETHRMQLIKHGTERRAENPSYWVQRVYESHCAANSVCIVSDHRFRNEGAALRALGARVITVRVQASDETRAARGWRYNAAVDTDPSERDLDAEAADFTLDNNAALPDVQPIIDAARALY